jgi:hypothetical protein
MSFNFYLRQCYSTLIGALNKFLPTLKTRNTVTKCCLQTIHRMYTFLRVSLLRHSSLTRILKMAVAREQINLKYAPINKQFFLTLD